MAIISESYVAKKPNVKEVGSAVTSLKPGDKVVLSYSSCGTCRYCSRAQNPYCEKLMALNFSGRRGNGEHAARDTDGKPIANFFFGQSSMGRLSLAHEACAVKVECTEDELIRFAALGCGFQTGFGAITNVCKPPPMSTIAIFGTGSVGLAAAFAAKLTSPSHLIIIDNAEAKLKILPEGLFTSSLNSAGLEEAEIAKKLRAITNGQGFDFVIDCVGIAQLVNAGHQALASRGMVVTVGGSHDSANINISKQLVGGCMYRGTHQGDCVPTTSIPKMIDLWRQGKFPFDTLLTSYEFHELHRGLEELQRGRTIKPLFRV